MEASRFLKFKNDEDRRGLEGLFDAFGSKISLEEITSVYHQAKKNAALAGSMLYDLQERTSCSSTFTTSSEPRSEVPSEVSSKESNHKNKNFRASKTRSCPSSMGNVSTVIGKSYWRPKQSANKTNEATKPLKLDEKEVPMTEPRGTKSNSEKVEDIEDFLFKMLGDGFKLDRDIIREVLGSCGYNMEKSMEKLLDLSEAAVEKRIQHNATKDSPENGIEVGPPSSAAGVLQTYEKEKLMEEEGIIKETQKEVLTSLFNVPNRYKDRSRSTLRVSKLNRYRVLGPLVDETCQDDSGENKIVIVDQHHEKEDGNEKYKALREAVKEYWAMAKKYYEASNEAFVNGDQVRGEKLSEQVEFFKEKAREADEESEKMLFGTGDDEAQGTLTLNLHEYCPKEAIRLLKCHLSSFTGIPSMTCLKIVIEKGQDTSKGARKRLILKLFERESIKWTEDGDAGTIQIRLNEINRKQLSFVKK